MPPDYFLNPAVWVPLLLWTISWKGFALWRAARNQQRWWFGILLVVNTLAILEILYLFVYGHRKAAQ